MSVPSGGRPACVDFHLDMMCPYAYQTSLWIREVRDRTGLQVNWRFFSLEEINRAEGKKHPWEREWSYGWSLMRIGALLRREGLYTSHLSQWRKQRGEGKLFEKKRGPAPKEKNPLAAKVAALEKETRRLKARAERAEALVDLQKKVSEILGIELKRNGEKD